MKRCLVLGAGRVGRAFDFIASDLELDFIDQVAGQNPPKNLKILAVESLTQDHLIGYDFVFNFLPLKFNHQILELVHKAGVAYLDLATEDIENPEQYNYPFENSLALINAGIAPGIDNLLVAELVERGAKNIEIYLIENQLGQDVVHSWCPVDADTSFDDDPVSAQNGKLISYKPFSDAKTIATTKGQFKCVRLFGEEILSLCKNYPHLNIDLRAGGRDVDAAIEGHVQKPQTSGEPDGYFGIWIRSDVGGYEIFFKPGSVLIAENKPGNYITWHTAYSAYAFYKSAQSGQLKGRYFPEELPKAIRTKVLSMIKSETTIWNEFTNENMA